jgi:hypothetical protein
MLNSRGKLNSPFDPAGKTSQARAEAVGDGVDGWAAIPVDMCGYPEGTKKMVRLIY